MGNVEAGAKVVLWSETRQPVQTWSAQMSGAVVSLTFPGMVLDIKGITDTEQTHPALNRMSGYLLSLIWVMLTLIT